MNKQEIIQKFTDNLLSKTGEDQITPEGLVEVLTEMLNFEQPIDLSSKADLINGVVPSNQLPGYVDDIVDGTFVNSSTFNDTNGNAINPLESGKIYIDTTSNLSYRWSGTMLSQLSSGSVGSENGLTKGSDDVIRLGGVVTENTRIDLGDPDNEELTLIFGSVNGDTFFIQGESIRWASPRTNASTKYPSCIRSGMDCCGF